MLESGCHSRPTVILRLCGPLGMDGLSKSPFRLRGGPRWTVQMDGMKAGRKMPGGTMSQTSQTSLQRSRRRWMKPSQWPSKRCGVSSKPGRLSRQEISREASIRSPLSKAASSSSSPTFLSEGFLGAAVGDPSYTGCFICGDKGHDFRSCPKRASGKGAKSKKGGHINFVDAVVYTVEEIPEEGQCFQNLGDTELPVPDEELSGYAVIDSGATETVCSLPALEALVKLKEARDGKPVGLEVTQEPVKRFKFGNGEHAYASSYVLLDQMLGERKIQLGMFTLDVEGVPVLLGMKTLRRLKAIIDFDRCLVVFAAVNPCLAIGLRRSRTGHLLLSLTQDWLSQGVHLDQLGSELNLHPEILQAEIEENETLTAFMVADSSRATSSMPADPQVRACAACVSSKSSASDAKTGEESSSSVPASCLKLTSPSGPQRLRSQASARMCTLKALLTFAALHGACFDNLPDGGNGKFSASSSVNQGRSQEQDQAQEGRSGYSSGGREGRRARFEGPSYNGPPVLRESYPSTSVPWISERSQPVWRLDRVLQVFAAPNRGASSGTARDLPALCTSGGRCQGGAPEPGSPDGGVPHQQGDQPPCGRELCASTSRTPSQDERGESSGSQAQGSAKAKGAPPSSTVAATTPTTLANGDSPPPRPTPPNETATTPNSNPSPVVVIPDTQEEMASHPGRKAARANETSAENLEYSTRS